ncbi:MAG: hypothetical protein EA446_03135 [Nitrosopumilus sp.]|nr:MAG: hypothetical protein EA446_03135 [Nitrosopumilus sp.]
MRHSDSISLDTCNKVERFEEKYTVLLCKRSSILEFNKKVFETGLGVFQESYIKSIILEEIDLVTSYTPTNISKTNVFYNLGPHLGTHHP